MIEIRSYRRVFDLERRIYRLDRLRLNPGGVPVRGIVYLLAILTSLTLLTHAPLIGAALDHIPWYILDAALPAATAALLAMIRLEGRPFHLAAVALLRYQAASPRRVGLTTRPAQGARWHPDTIVILPDGGDARLRALRFRGPGAVVVAVHHQRSWRVRRSLALRPGSRAPRAEMVMHPTALAGRPAKREVILLAPGARLRVSGSARERRAG